MTGPQRPGCLPDCPPWCEVNHGEPLDSMHSRYVGGEIRSGPAITAVRVTWDPRGFMPSLKTPKVSVLGWRSETLLEKHGPAALDLSAAAAVQFAGFMDVLDHAEFATAVRRGAELIADGGSR